MSRCRIVSATDPSALELATEVIGNDGLVALPTETVYGLAGSIASPEAISKIFEVKSRPHNHPLIVHIADLEDAETYAEPFGSLARKCAEACWPGPLTMLMRRTSATPPEVVGGLDKVALRIPANEFTRSVIRGLGTAVAAPSANRFGRVSPTTASHVLSDIGDDIDLIIDGGSSLIGLESTIVDFTTSEPTLLRPGGLSIEDLEDVLGCPIASSGVGGERVSGALPAHYQPDATVLLAESAEEYQLIVEELRASGRRFSTLVNEDQLPLLACTLYSQLRAADEHGSEFFVARMPTSTGLGLAIRDRLRKAAGPRPT